MANVTHHIIRRVGRHLPADLQGLARAVKAARSGSAVVEVPDAEAVLVVGAHPDDETVVAGGTIAGLADRGVRVEVVLATAGEATAGSDLGKDEIRVLRTSEAEAACLILGAQKPTVFDFPDGAVSEHVIEFAGQIDRLITQMTPDLIFVPWWLDDHPDHRAVATAVALASVPASTSIWSGEIWTPLVPNRIVDVTETIGRKRDAIAAHRTAHEALDMDAFIGLNRYRSIRGLRGAGYAEAFAVCDPSAHRELLGFPDA